MSELMRTSRARFDVVMAALLFSTGGAAIKVAAFTAAQVSCLRSAIAAVALMLWVRHRLRWSPAIVITGVFYAATLSLFVAATRLTTAANAIFLQSTAPLYVLLLAPWLLGERFHRRDLLYFAFIAAGLLLCVSGQTSASSSEGHDCASEGGAALMIATRMFLAAKNTCLATKNTKNTKGLS